MNNRPYDNRNRPAYISQPQPHMRHPREQSNMSGPPYQHGPPQRPPPSESPHLIRPPMNMRNNEAFHNSALTFNGSSQSLLASGPKAQVRKPTIRHIPLTPEGNLVVDVPVPDRVLSNAKYQSGDEFTYTRYTAVTSSPDQFPYSGYSLRQQEMQRSTEIFIVVTM